MEVKIINDGPVTIIIDSKQEVKVNPVLMIFIDGVGIGREDYEYNPFFKYGLQDESS